MEALGVITRVTEPMDWCSAMLIREKNNSSLLICLDPRPLNKALKRELYPIPNYDTIFTAVQGSKFFSAIELTNGFWQIQLDDPSSWLCTFATLFGHYRFCRLPFGISPAPEIFHRLVSQALEPTSGVISYIDDILVHGRTQDEHDHRLTAILDILQWEGFTINAEKSKFSQQQITFLGHVLTQNAISPDPAKVSAISQLLMPQNRTDLRQILGRVTFLAKFLPNLSETLAPLNALLCKNAIWIWDQQHIRALDAMHHALAQFLRLLLYNLGKPLTLAADASAFGLGAVILQEGQLLSYASRMMTTAERNYSQIEKEFLAILFILERFHYFLMSVLFPNTFYFGSPCSLFRLND